MKTPIPTSPVLFTRATYKDNKLTIWSHDRSGRHAVRRIHVVLDNIEIVTLGTRTSDGSIGYIKGGESELHWPTAYDPSLQGKHRKVELELGIEQ